MDVPTGDPWAPQRAAVRRALDERGMIQADLAVALGISRKHMSQVLNGRVDGSVRLWVRIAAVLGCSWVLALDPDGRSDRRTR